MKITNKYLLAIAFLLLFGGTFASCDDETPIIDSKMTFKEAIKGSPAPQEIIDQLVLLDVRYLSTDGKLHQGQLVVNKMVEEDVKTMFDFMLSEKFIVEKCIPIVKYKWSDDASMRDNNSSSFNYREIAGSKTISRHATGTAVDINPKWNPAVSDDHISPENGKYDTNAIGTLTATSPTTKKFKSLGWVWGGDWHSFQDYQHFDKR